MNDNMVLPGTSERHLAACLGDAVLLHGNPVWIQNLLEKSLTPVKVSL